MGKAWRYSKKNFKRDLKRFLIKNIHTFFAERIDFRLEEELVKF